MAAFDAMAIKCDGDVGVLLADEITAIHDMDCGWPVRKDDQMYDILEDTILPKLAHKEEWPWVITIMNDDTHLPYSWGPWCKNELAAKGYPQPYQSFTCADQHLKRFMETLHKLGLDNNTEVLIYGDHLSMQAGHIVGERNLTLVLPFHPQDSRWKRSHEGRQVSYYDIAPTIMDLLNIEYSPKFVFGRSLFGEEPGSVPTHDDLQLIYQIAVGERQARCQGRTGLCKGNEF
jgi:hypothetical protein